MTPSWNGSFVESPQLQFYASFGHSSKEKPGSLGKRTAWEFPTARLGAGVYTQLPQCAPEKGQNKVC